jgi:membrane protease YdiL (CAAX protease family)
MEKTPSAESLVISALVFYTLMTLMGLGMMFAQDLPVSTAVFGDGKTVLRDTALGSISGLAVVFLTWAARNWPRMKELNEEFKSLLGRPGTGAIAALAVSSAIGEEVFFRGGLQSLLSFWPTALIFGLMHGGTGRRFRLWAVFATVAGMLLGWLTEETNNLLAAILCHLTINYFNLHLVVQDGKERV